MDESSGGISRRRVMLGAAWSAPAILIATSVPARAASLEGILVVDSMQVALTAEDPARLRIDLPAIRNSGSTAWTNVTVQFTVPGAEALDTYEATGNGWVVSPSGTDPRVFTAVYSSTIPGNGTSNSGFMAIDRPVGAPASGTVLASGSAVSSPPGDTTSILFPNGGTFNYT